MPRFASRALLLGVVLSAPTPSPAQEREYPVLHSIGRYFGVGYTHHGYHAAVDNRCDIVTANHPASQYGSRHLQYIYHNHYQAGCGPLVSVQTAPMLPAGLVPPMDISIPAAPEAAPAAEDPAAEDPAAGVEVSAPGQNASQAESPTVIYQPQSASLSQLVPGLIEEVTSPATKAASPTDQPAAAVAPQPTPKETSPSDQPVEEARDLLLPADEISRLLKPLLQQPFSQKARPVQPPAAAEQATPPAPTRIKRYQQAQNVEQGTPNR